MWIRCLETRTNQKGKLSARIQSDTHCSSKETKMDRARRLKRWIGRTATYLLGSCLPRENRRGKRSCHPEDNIENDPGHEEAPSGEIQPPAGGCSSAKLSPVRGEKKKKKFSNTFFFLRAHLTSKIPRGRRLPP